MANGSKGYVGRGAGLACRDWPCFLWLYLANLLLAVAGTAGVAAQLGDVLDKSLYSQGLVHGFNLTVLAELLLRPQISLHTAVQAPALLALVFAGLTLFLTAGIVQSFLSDEHLSIGPFFQACGTWLWRFTRLTFLTLLIFGIVMGVLGALRSVVVGWADKSPNPRVYFYVGLATLLMLWLVAVFLRLWFDLAQFHLVHTGERKVRRAIPAGFRLLRQGCARLFWIYFSITLVGWVGLAAGVWLWLKLPPARVGLAFLVGQAVLFVWLATRYWQRAAEALWFRAHAPAPTTAPAAPEPVLLAPLPAPASEPPLSS